jgi:hypothetical protein
MSEDEIIESEKASANRDMRDWSGSEEGKAFSAARDAELSVAEQERLMIAHTYGLTRNGVEGPDCPRCGQKMGPQTQPLDGSWWCPNTRCGYHWEPPSPQRSAEL